jgi:hypothetical protein
MRASAGGDNGIAATTADRFDAVRALRWFSLILFLAVAAVGAVLSGPIFHMDEGSYLLNAAALAGKLRSSLVFGYYSGYSVLLVPAYLLLPAFAAIYHYALLVNALLLATLPFALVRILRWTVPEAAPRWHVLGAAVASCQTAVLTTSQMTISENLLIPLYAWLLACGASALFKRSNTDAVIAGAIAGCLFLVHPRGATMALPVLTALSLPCVRERGLRMPTLCLWLAAALVAALHVPLEWFAQKSADSQIVTYSLPILLGKLTSLRVWGQVAFNAFGTLTYSAIATFGVLFLGLRAATLRFSQMRPHRGEGIEPRDAVLLAATLGLLANIFVTAAYFNTPDRVDQLIYGRYTLPLLIPLLAFGLVQLRTANGGLPSPAWSATAATLGCIFVMALLFRFVPHPPADTWVHVNIIDLYIPFSLIGRVDWPTIGFYFCAIAFAIYSTCRVSPLAAAVLFGLINIAVAGFITIDQTLPSHALRARERQSEVAVREFEKATATPLCVSIASELDNWHSFDYQNWLFDRVDESAVVDRARCVHAIIASLTNQRPNYPRYRLISTDQSNPYGLFVEESPALASFAGSHALPPIDFPAPLAENERSAKIELLGIDKDPHVKVGQPFALNARVTHAGGNVVWPARFDPSPLLAIRVGARLDPLDAGGDPHVEFRADLPDSLDPGESATVHLDLGPISKAGRYTVTVGVLQEGFTWFDPTTSFTITATAP